MNNSITTPPSLDEFCRLDRLGLSVTGQQVQPRRSILECRIIEPGDICGECAGSGAWRDTVTRELAHVPHGYWATVLRVRIRRYRCRDCGRLWRQPMPAAAEPGRKLSRQAVVWALKSIVCDQMSISRVAAGLGVSWNTANTAVMQAGLQLLIDDPHRFDGVQVIGVDEHVWRHTRRGDKYVTVIIDLTPVRDDTGPSRLLDMVTGRSKDVFKTWLATQPAEFRDGIEIVAMDGFTGYKTAAVEELPEAVEVMDPFHVVALAGQKLDTCRQRVQQETLGHRGRAGDPLYGIRRLLRTGHRLLSQRQWHRLAPVLECDRHAEVEVTWGIYQRIIDAYREPEPARGKTIMTAVIDAISHGVPHSLSEVRQLGGTLKRRRDDVLAYFDHPGSSNGPTEAINGRLEHLRGTALGFRNLTHYMIRSLLAVGGFRDLMHSLL